MSTVTPKEQLISLRHIEHVSRCQALRAWTPARANARSGDRISLAAYLGKSPKFDTAIGASSDAHADQNDRDYESSS